MPNNAVENVFWCCESNLPIFAPASGYAKDGETWKCPTCGEEWVHLCDEAEGCSWELVSYYLPPNVKCGGGRKFATFLRQKGKEVVLRKPDGSKVRVDAESVRKIEGTA